MFWKWKLFTTDPGNTHRLLPDTHPCGGDYGRVFWVARWDAQYDCDLNLVVDFF